MTQPKWKLVANLGDLSPFDHGGLFVYEDETGVYPPEMEKLDSVNEDDDDIDPYEVAARDWLNTRSKEELIELCDYHGLYANCELMMQFTEEDDYQYMLDVISDEAILNYEEFCKEHGIEVDELDDGRKYLAYRVVLEKCYMGESGHVSDNEFHQNHPAWFDAVIDEKRPQDGDRLLGVARSYGIGADELRDWLCGDDILRRATAYDCIYGYHGWENGDNYPIELNHREAIERYKADLAALKEVR